MAICGAGPPDFFGPAPSHPLEGLSTISTGSKIPKTIPNGSSDTQTEELRYWSRSPSKWRGSNFGRGACATEVRTMAICGAGPPDFFGPAPSHPLEGLSTISTGSKIPKTIPNGSSDTQTGSKIPKTIPEGSSDTQTGSIIPETIPEGHSGSVTGLKIRVLIQAGVLDGVRRSRWSDRRLTPTPSRRPSKAYHRRLLPF